MTEQNRMTIINALYVAAEKYSSNVKVLNEIGGHAVLAEQFKKQSADAVKIAEMLSNEQEGEL